MARSDSEGFGSFLFGAGLLTAVLILGIVVTPIMLVGIPAYVFYRLYTENPRRLERLAREETEILYNHALSGSVRLSEQEVDEGFFAQLVLNQRCQPVVALTEVYWFGRHDDPHPVRRKHHARADRACTI